jgi:hypothetical protein
MPLKWTRGVNPYVVNYFGKLQVGPNAEPRVFSARAKNFNQKIAAGETVILGGQSLDEHAINEASKKLLDAQTRAGELLLAHPQGADERSRLKSATRKIKEAATLPEPRSWPALMDAASLLWFLPAPEPSAAVLPPLDALGLDRAGSAADLELDIVFDR